MFLDKLDNLPLCKEFKKQLMNVWMKLAMNESNRTPLKFT